MAPGAKSTSLSIPDQDISRSARVQSRLGSTVSTRRLVQHPRARRPLALAFQTSSLGL